MPEKTFEEKSHRKGLIDVLIKWALLLSAFLLIAVFGVRCTIRGLVSYRGERWVRADFNSFTSALKRYKVNDGSYPSDKQGLRVLVEPPAGSPKPLRWTKLMDVVPKDPWGRAYRYRRIDKDFELTSDGKDGVPGTNDDFSNLKE